MDSFDVVLEGILERASFEERGTCAARDLQVSSEVRDMCASGSCRQYGRNWACPPACGELEDYRAAISRYRTCHVVQTVGTLKGEFDGRGMLEAERVHKARVGEVAREIGEGGLDALVLSAGTCTVCDSCAYPSACRYPGRRLVSMEAAGLMVSEVCKLAGVPYGHGPLTTTFTSAVLS